MEIVFDTITLMDELGFVAGDTGILVMQVRFPQALSRNDCHKPSHYYSADVNDR